MNNKQKILVLISHYLPGFKAGGPIRSIEGLVCALSEDYDFFIVTHDRDLNEIDPYIGIKYNEWNIVGNSKVFYLKKNVSNIFKIIKILRQDNYDLLYLNSFFSPKMSILPIILRKFHLIPKKPVILAPRGEFSEGALKFKLLKKKIYIKLFSSMSLLEELHWQASSEYEKQDIQRVFRKLPIDHIHVAGNLSANPILNADFRNLDNTYLPTERLKIVFLSRITRKKNLDYALIVLHHIKFNADFDIFGPIEDIAYWHSCKKIIDTMPTNIKVKYKGTLTHESVVSTLYNYDLFFVPTLGENYGHVFEEAIRAGLVILVSDQTPWRDLKSFGIGCDLPLNNINKYIDFLNDYSSLTHENKKVIKSNIINYSLNNLNKDVNRENTLRMIRNVVSPS